MSFLSSSTRSGLTATEQEAIYAAHHRGDCLILFACTLYECCLPLLAISTAPMKSNGEKTQTASSHLAKIRRLICQFSRAQITPRHRVWRFPVSSLILANFVHLACIPRAATSAKEVRPITAFNSITYSSLPKINDKQLIRLGLIIGASAIFYSRNHQTTSSFHASAPSRLSQEALEEDLADIRKAQAMNGPEVFEELSKQSIAALSIYMPFAEASRLVTDALDEIRRDVGKSPAIFSKDYCEHYLKSNVYDPVAKLYQEVGETPTFVHPHGIFSSPCMLLGLYSPECEGTTLFNSKCFTSLHLARRQFDRSNIFASDAYGVKRDLHHNAPKSANPTFESPVAEKDTEIFLSMHRSHMESCFKREDSMILVVEGKPNRLMLDEVLQELQQKDPEFAPIATFALTFPVPPLRHRNVPEGTTASTSVRIFREANDKLVFVFALDHWSIGTYSLHRSLTLWCSGLIQDNLMNMLAYLANLRHSTTVDDQYLSGYLLSCLPARIDGHVSSDRRPTTDLDLARMMRAQEMAGRINYTYGEISGGILDWAELIGWRFALINRDESILASILRHYGTRSWKRTMARMAAEAEEAGEDTKEYMRGNLAWWSSEAHRKSEVTKRRNLTSKLAKSSLWLASGVTLFGTDWFVSQVKDEEQITEKDAHAIRCSISQILLCKSHEARRRAGLKTVRSTRYPDRDLQLLRIDHLEPYDGCYLQWLAGECDVKLRPSGNASTRFKRAWDLMIEDIPKWTPEGLEQLDHNKKVARCKILWIKRALESGNVKFDVGSVGE